MDNRQTIIWFSRMRLPRQNTPRNDTIAVINKILVFYEKWIKSLN